MNNSHDEIKKLLEASRALLSKGITSEEYSNIRKKYNLITEQDEQLTSGNVTTKSNVGASIEDRIGDDFDSDEEIDQEDDFEEKIKKDKKQGYRISGGILVLHGKEQVDLELTTDEKIAFQETMDEFVEDVSEFTDFGRLNVYDHNVEWSGKITDMDIEFFFSIGEENGVYIKGEMIKADDVFLELVNNLKSFYDKFKSKWGKIIAMRKKTKKSNDEI